MSHSSNRTEPISVSTAVIAGANSAQSSSFGNAANILAMSDNFTRSKAHFASSSSSSAPRASEQSHASLSTPPSSAQQVQQQGQQRAAEGQVPMRSVTQLQPPPLERLATEELLQRLQVIGNAITSAQTRQEREKFIEEGRQTSTMLMLYNKQQRAMIDNPRQFMTRVDAGIEGMNLDEQNRMFERLEARYVNLNTMNTEEQIRMYQCMFTIAESIRELQAASQKSSRPAAAVASSSSRTVAREEDIVSSFSRMSVNNKNNAVPVQSRGNELNDADYGGQRVDARMVNADNNNNNNNNNGAYDQRYQSSNPYSGYGQGNNNGNSNNQYRGGNNYGNNGGNNYGRNNY
jgi:hypothetical protein